MKKKEILATIDNWHSTLEDQTRTRSSKNYTFTSLNIGVEPIDLKV